MLIGTCQRMQRLRDAIALIKHSRNGWGLPDLEQYNYLGSTIRCNLMWDVQIHNLCSKTSQKIGLVFRLRHKVPRSKLMIV